MNLNSTNLTSRQSRAMQLSGTVSFPATFPDLGEITLVQSACTQRTLNGQCDLVRIEQPMTPKLTVVRLVHINDVEVMFVPRAHGAVDLRFGDWLVGVEIPMFLNNAAREDALPVLGIVYVRESAPTLTQVEVGMSAAQSAEYYPPLGDDRAVDHYRFDVSAKRDPC
ncbi:MAG: hypothetical protein R3C99_03840 [Pirellulaceae bacterium]|nr:hypothetical protein [Planctomycetales bacterium]MCA9164253.1 hypothetical protein [Planctomycetales bacterium]MCA9204630.1 hypothetical protein [Planctomycetales bacterium]MCA9208167.1 hypothetical protein [Planctomycetales bacterium]MCA9221401.1 hypothetical protein [Planctomycetales bacterium]